MVQMAMGDKERLDIMLLFSRCRSHHAAGIDGDAVIQEETRVFGILYLYVMSPQDADIHRPSLRRAE